MHESTPAGRRLPRNGVLLSGAIAALLLMPPAAAVSAVEAAPSPVAQDAAAATAFTLSATTAKTGAKLTIDYRTDAPHAENWIGIYRDGVAPGPTPSVIWKYIPGVAGSVEFTLDLDPGTYDVWMLARGGYTALAPMQELTVEGDPDAPTPGDPNTPVEIDPVSTDVSTDGVIFREPFAAEAPAGWAVEFDEAMAGVGEAAFRGWQFSTRADWQRGGDEMRDRFGRADGSFAVADGQRFGDHDTATTLRSVPVDVTGLGEIRLSFDSHYRGAPGQAGIVRASFDGQEPVEVLRLDSSTVSDGYDGMEMNAAHDLLIDTPARAKSVVFSWEFTGGADSRYWAIDSVAVHRAQADTAATPTQAWVVSDIQGHPNDFAHGIEDFAKLSPNANGLLMVGDIVNSGTVREWDEIDEVMEKSEGVRPPQTVAGIGNHERYAGGGFQANYDRFLAFAERDTSWGEYVLEGPAGDLPVIVLGQEFSGPSDVPMSEAQVRFLEERLAHWTAQDKQVVVMSHFPLGNTVSASWLPWYSNHHQHNNRLTSILGNYPNAVVLSGHTHYPAELGDWAMQRRTADGHPDGFWAVNTLAMHIEWDARGENTAGIQEVTTRDVNRGLTLDSYGDRIVITAHDFATDEQLRQVTIPNPLVPYTAVIAPDAERDADYAAVDAALATVPADLAPFTERTVTALTRAVDAVDRSLAADQQARVDEMARAVTDAVAGLERRPTVVDPDADGDGNTDGNTGGNTDGNTGGGTSGGTTPDAESGTPGTASPAPGGGLAETGAEGGAWGLWAAVGGLLAAGAGVFALRRRGRGTAETAE